MTAIVLSNRILKLDILYNYDIIEKEEKTTGILNRRKTNLLHLLKSSIKKVSGKVNRLFNYPTEEKNMKLNNARRLMLFVLTLVCFQALASAQIVYDSLSTTPVSSIGINDIGNTITLSGSKCFVTSFTVNVTINSQNIGQTNDYILRFYLPTGLNGYPVKLFWQSRPKANVIMTGDTQSITFDVPYVRVPNTFIYSVMQAGDGIFLLCSGPTVGTSPAYCWTNLAKQSLPGSNHLQVRIEAQDRPDAVLLGKIRHNSTAGIGGDDYYMTRFQMNPGGYWNMFGPSFFGVTELDKGSYLQIKAEDIPEAVDYLTNGVDESLIVQAEFALKGNVESDTIVKSPGIAVGYPDLYGCIITDTGLKLDNIIIDHSTPGTTWYTWDVTWEIWGIQKSADISRDGKVDYNDFAIFAGSWKSQTGLTNWNPLCDINLPADNRVDIFDLQRFCSDWLKGYDTVFIENFETGDFFLYFWQHSGNDYWLITTNSVYEGTYAATSGNISDNQTSSLELEVLVEGTQISFYRKVSSEASFDYLRFYIDGVEQNKWSGSVEWSQVSFPVTAGIHTFKWSYTKDGSVSSGEDSAWIDMIKIE